MRRRGSRGEQRRGRSGGAAGRDGAGEGLPPGRRRARHLPALARRRRLQPRGQGLARRLEQAALRHHPAAAERDRLAAPGPCPALHGRGPDDPARPNAGPAGALPAGPRPRFDRRAVRPGQASREEGRDAPDPRPREVPRGDVGVRPRDARDDPGPAAPGRRLARHEPPALHDGRSLGARRARGLPAPLPRRPGLPDRGPDPLVPRLPDQRLGPGGHSERNDRQPLDDALPPDRRDDRRPGSERLDRRGHDAPGDAPGRHGRGREPGGSALHRPGRPPGDDPVRRSRGADHRRPGGGSGLRDRRGQDHPRPRPGRLRDRQAPRPADDHRARRRRPHQRERRPVRRPGPLRGPPPDRGSPASPRRHGVDQAPRDAARPLPALRRRRGASPQDAVVRAASRRSRQPPWRRPARARRRFCRSASSRSGSTG